MKKRITALTLSVLLLLLSVLLLSACSEKGGNTEETAAGAAGGEVSAEPAAEEETAWIDTLPEVDYGGYTFNMAWSTPNMSWNEMAPDADEIAGDLVGEAVHQRNLLTEDRLNISITAQPATQSWTTVNTDIKNLVLAGDTSVDAYGVSTWFMFKASIDGLLYNLDTVETLDLSHDWWEHGLNEMMSLNGKQHYMANGMINYLDDYAISCLYFNKPLCTDLGLEHPYELVRNGEWTLDRFLTYVESSSADLDGNGVWDENDRYGLVENSGLLNRFLPSFGTQVVGFDENGDGTINQTEIFFDQLDRMTEALLDLHNAAVLLRDRALGYEKADTVFPGGRALFFGEMVNSITTFRETMDPDFGLIPYPKYTEEQAQYYSSYNTAWGTSYGFPVTNPDLNRSGQILEVMGYYSMDTIYPASIEKNILTKTVRDEESSDMLRLMFECKFYELGSWGTSVYGNLCGMASSGKNNFVSSLKSIVKINAKEFEAVKSYYDFGN